VKQTQKQCSNTETVKQNDGETETDAQTDSETNKRQTKWLTETVHTIIFTSVISPVKTLSNAGNGTIQGDITSGNITDTEKENPPSLSRHNQN